ncbi:restriction endonuclease subunit S [Hydrogeniiclostridium mannosilyticum]|uniref:Restriction endonuclease subunit S n=1 Tax=Hydrogeniiclostridium mannosilyticum TaxID=2764322 RepID=A0A328UE83_9FIRM|nr:restriction endonuclease subunit S [Hydrogeniiclostridium mannosilyticum]RAQ29331.1 restriction endonuclease subunit S [Hydrogeniiclostridium mannosilyticum]
MARLGDVATYINGYAFKPEDWSDTGLPIIRIQDLTGNSYQANRYNGEYAPKYEVNDGDVLISWSASLGVYIWHGEKALLNQHIFKVVFDKTDISKSFFVHQVENILEKAASSAHGATMKHLTKPVFDALPFYLPPLDKQRKIAAVLDKVSGLIAKRRQQLEKLDEMVKARFVEMFGTLSHPSQKFKYDILKNLCRKITDGKHGGCTPQLGSGRYFVGAREIFDDTVHYETAPEIAIDEFEKDYKRCNLEIGDLLIVNTGATIGKSAIACDFRAQHTLLQKSVALLKVKSELINPVFLKYCYRVNETMYKVESASAQPNLLLSKINTTSIYVPPMALQNQFAAFIEQTEKSKTTISHSLEKLEILKKALMQEYFG